MSIQAGFGAHKTLVEANRSGTFPKPMSEDPIKQLREALASIDPAENLAKCMTTFKQQGISKRQLFDWLTTLRGELAADPDERKDDAILEAMDFLSRDL